MNKLKLIKNVLIRCFSILTFLIFAQNGMGQYTSKKKRAIENYVDGVKYDRMYNFQSAISKFNTALEKDPNFIEVHISLGDIYLKTKNYKKSAEAYKKSLQIDPNFKPTTYMQLASVELRLAEYNNALMHLNELKKLEKIPPPWQSKFDLMVETANFAINAKKHPVPFNPENIGRAINTKEEEYHPSITADGEYFVFTKKQFVGNTKLGDPVYKEDLYYSKKNKLGKWATSKNFGPPINTIRNNEGASSISHDGKYLFFTACDLPNGMGSCDLYVTQQQGGKWYPPRNLGTQINTGAWESHPSLSPNGKTLYFASNRKGGKGGVDIWESKKLSDGSWSEPKSLPFNTRESDFTPHIHADGQTMYFSSSGRPGMGGHDVYMVRKLPNGNWGKVKNIGYPINSELDEFGMIADPSGRMAYYASEKNGGEGKLDIYQFDLYKEIQPITTSYLKGKVVNAETKNPLGAVIQLIDLSTQQVITGTESDKLNGNFLTSLPANRNYALNVSKKGFLFYSDNFELKEQNVSEPKFLQIELIPIKEGASIVLKNVFFETASYDLKPESMVELNKLVTFIKSNPKMQIEIGGHTDNVGEAKMNKELSANRAQSVKNYLVKNGASADKVLTAGYGDTQPIADNSTAEGRAKNRRTEFVVSVLTAIKQ